MSKNTKSQHQEVNRSHFFILHDMEKALLHYLQTFLTERRKGLFNKALANRTRHFTVVTEDVYQLHNTSAVMRSCDVFGIQDLHVIEAKLGKRVDREIAMGAQKWVDIHRHHNTKNCLTELKKQGYAIAATTPHGQAIELKDFDVRQKTAFVFGTETQGVSAETLQQADLCVKIPMYGFTESLNISVSAAIILQDIVSRMHQSDISWGLSDRECGEIAMRWTKANIKGVDQIIERYHQNNNDL
mgnify:CR=1 FL=1